MLKISKHDEGGVSKQHSLVGITQQQIEQALGFEPNILEDEYKVTASWGFICNGVRCGIWDWKGSADDNEWSAYGPREMFVELFGEEHVA